MIKVRKKPEIEWIWYSRYNIGICIMWFPLYVQKPQSSGKVEEKRISLKNPKIWLMYQRYDDFLWALFLSFPLVFCKKQKHLENWKSYPYVWL